MNFRWMAWRGALRSFLPGVDFVLQDLWRRQAARPGCSGSFRKMQSACDKAWRVVALSLAKARFWASHAEKNLNARQRKVVNGPLDAGPRGFEGGMNTGKYEAMTATSRAAAYRELVELANLGVLAVTGAGRSARYHLVPEGWALVPAVG